ncbi:MAG: SdpI family protein [Eubacteriales bacterium]|nr:SdpI family protein [Eubacteriales bacterium]
MKINKTTQILTTIVCLIPIIIGIILLPQLPDQIATHWDSAGNVNGVSSKFMAVIGYPGILLLVNIAMPFLLKMDPKHQNMGDKLVSLVMWIIPFVSLLCSAMTLSNALGKSLPVQIIIPTLLGVLFVAIGNYLPKTKQTYTMGIKLPWTFNSEENWNRTHRLAGFIWVFCGILIIIGSFLPYTEIITAVCLIVMVFVPGIYSYVYYLKNEKQG